MTEPTNEPIEDDGIDTTEAPEPRELSGVEQLAVKMGWKPEDEYAGPKDKWRPAEDFILAEREINRGMKQQMRSLSETVERMANAATKQTARALERQAAELKQQFEEAVANRDTAGAARAVQELQELEREATNAAPTANVEQDFAARNPWYGTDDEATAYAISVSQREAAKGKSHSEQLAAVEAAIAKRFPELVGGTPQPRTPAAVNTPARAAAKPRVKGFNELPAEVKRAAEDFARLFKEKHGVDPEEAKANYARDYWSDQAA